jgi:hypothetical protein
MAIRYGETIRTAFVESTINQVVSRRFVKKQQMQWTLRGAHLLLQTRTKVLNHELDEVSAGGIRNSGCSHKCRNQSGRRLDPRLSDALNESVIGVYLRSSAAQVSRDRTLASSPETIW